MTAVPPVSAFAILHSFFLSSFFLFIYFFSLDEAV